MLTVFFCGCISQEKPDVGRTACFEDGFCVKIEVVSEPDDVSRGLMYRDGLAADSGMFFVFERAFAYPFWMKNMKFPIDIIWMNEEGVVVHVERDVPPCTQDPCPTYPPRQAALYVLEINANETVKHSITDGSKIKIT